MRAQAEWLIQAAKGWPDGEHFIFDWGQLSRREAWDGEDPKCIMHVLKRATTGTKMIDGVKRVVRIMVACKEYSGASGCQLTLWVKLNAATGTFVFPSTHDAEYRHSAYCKHAEHSVVPEGLPGPQCMPKTEATPKEKKGGKKGGTFGERALAFASFTRPLYVGPLLFGILAR